MKRWVAWLSLWNWHCVKQTSHSQFGPTSNHEIFPDKCPCSLQLFYKILLRYLTLMPKISLANMQNRVWILPFESIRWQTIRKTRWVLLFQNKYVVRRKTANCKSSLTNNKYNLLPNQQNWLLEMWLQRSFYLGCFQLGFHGILGPRQSKDSPRSYRSATIDSNF